MMMLVVIAGLAALFIWKIRPFDRITSPGDPGPGGTSPNPDQNTSDEEYWARIRDDYRETMEPILAWLTECDRVYTDLISKDVENCGQYRFGEYTTFQGWHQMFHRLKAIYADGGWVAGSDLEHIAALYSGEVLPGWGSHISGLRHDRRGCANVMQDYLNVVTININKLNGMPQSLANFYSRHAGVDPEPEF